MPSLNTRSHQARRLAATALSTLLYLPFLVSAQSSSAVGGKLESGLQQVINLLTGNIARSLAILAAIAFGIGALSGRVDWIKAVTVILGIGVIFSASTLVDLFTK